MEYVKYIAPEGYVYKEGETTTKVVIVPKNSNVIDNYELIKEVK